MFNRTFARAVPFLALALSVFFFACSDDDANGPTNNSTGGAGGGTGGSGAGGVVIEEGHPRIYLNADNMARLQASLDADEPAAVRFLDMVDNQMGGADLYEFEANFAALLGALGRGDAYCAFAVDMVDERLTSEEALIAQGQPAEVSADSYLYVGDIVGDLALVYDWCNDSLTADQRSRIIAYGNQAVWNVWNHEQATWGGVSHPWSGWSVTNPSNNYYYSFLRATMLLGLATLNENDQAQTWIDRFRDDKIAAELVPTFAADLQGGGSREGTGYGTAMYRLFSLYDIWEATTSERIWDLTEHTRASLPNMMHYTMPTLDRIAPIGDHSRDSSAALFDYHRAYVLTLQRLLGSDDPFAQVAQTWLNDCSVPEMSQFFMYLTDFLYADPDHASRPLSDLHPSYYAPGTGSVFFRTGWDTAATWGALIAGPYTESHAHRDQGSLLVYQGSWLAYDQNILSHSGIYQEEPAHNLVWIDDAGSPAAMHEGESTLLALREVGGALYVAADITPVYSGVTPVVRVEREVIFFKEHGTIVVMDRVDTSGGAEAVWSLNSPVAPSTVSGGFQVDNGESLLIRPLFPSNASSSVLDWTTDADMIGGYRLDLRDPGANGSARFLVVLGDPSVIASMQPTSDSTHIGATINFSDGSDADVSFSRDAIGAQLRVTTSGGSTVGHDGALSAGIDTLPVLDTN